MREEYEECDGEVALTGFIDGKGVGAMAAKMSTADSCLWGAESKERRPTGGRICGSVTLLAITRRGVAVGQNGGNRDGDQGLQNGQVLCCTVIKHVVPELSTVLIKGLSVCVSYICLF